MMPYRVNHTYGSPYEGTSITYDIFDTLPAALEEAASLLAQKRCGREIHEVTIDEYTVLCGPPEDMITAAINKLRESDALMKKARAEYQLKQDIAELSSKAQKIANTTGQAVSILVHPQVIEASK